MPSRGTPTVATVHRTLNELAGTAYTAVLTSALAPEDQAPFLDAGFEVHERLHLLVRSLEQLPRASGVAIRRGHMADRPRVLAVDASAFPPFWRLDASGLDDALGATPSSRFRVVAAPDGDRATVAYAITGRAGPRGYLQRLAVDPAYQRSGIGAALVVDGLRWLKRWGAKEVLVNTQEGNEPAVRLYEALGFRHRPDGLAVLRCSLSRAQ
jgi:ribosomal protein S18 acetylase RimI-like enzyme